MHPLPCPSWNVKDESSSGCYYIAKRLQQTEHASDIVDTPVNMAHASCRELQMEPTYIQQSSIKVMSEGMKQHKNPWSGAGGLSKSQRERREIYCKHGTLDKSWFDWLWNYNADKHTWDVNTLTMKPAARTCHGGMEKVCMGQNIVYESLDMPLFTNESCVNIIMDQRKQQINDANWKC